MRYLKFSNPIQNPESKKTLRISYVYPWGLSLGLLILGGGGGGGVDLHD